MGRPTIRPKSETIHRLVERLTEQVGDEVAGLELALEETSPVSIRVHPTKWEGPGTPPVPWCSSGHYLAERPSFTFDPLFHAGAYYVQEASSMLVEQAVKAAGLQFAPIVALDLCAAPGGKSTHLRSMLHPDALVVSNEIDRKRQQVLLENVWKWGIPGTVVTGNAPSDLQRLPEFFDLTLVDAPCSGEGMFRKDPFACQQWTPELVNSCARTQSEILDHAWSALRPGGHLIYSTCTWELAENEEQLAQLVERGAHLVPFDLDSSWGIVRTERKGISGARCYPHRSVGEGFFCAVLRKPGEWEPRIQREVGQRTHVTELDWLTEPQEWHVRDHDQVRFAIQDQHASVVAQLEGALRVLAPGIPLAERKAELWRPHPALALNTALNNDAFTRVELDHQQAIAFLQGAALPAQHAEGIALATHRGINLGWLQGARNRWNNRWPAPWRIRAHRPSAPLVSWADAGNKLA